MIWRYFPPKGGGTDAPGTLASWLRIGELAEIAQLGLVQALAFERDQADRQARGVELLDDRRQRAGRQAAQVGHREVRDLGDVRVGARARLEVDLDDADAGQRPRLHVIDAGPEREEPLEAAGDVGLDLLGRHAVVERGDDDLRDVDVGKQVDGHAHDAREPDDGDDQPDDDDEVRVANGESGHQRRLLRRRRRHDLRRDQGARFQLGAVADDHQLTRVQPALDLDAVGGLETDADLARLDAVVGLIDERHRRGAVSGSIGLNRGDQDVLGLIEHEG